jgi:hypothetical protein
MKFATHHGPLLYRGVGALSVALTFFARNKRIASGGDETGDLQGFAQKNLKRENPAELYRKMKGRRWNFFFRPQLRT